MYKQLLLLAVLLWASSALSYRLHEHKIVTRCAVSVFNACQTKMVFSALDTQSLVQGNLSEDYNLLAKWLRSSHYYNPERRVSKLLRNDALSRVRYLEKQPSSLRKLGKIIHFVQDVTSPPHVIPVAHNLSDGFEKFQVREKDLIRSKYTCPTEIRSPGVVLKHTALQTLTRLNEEAKAQRDDQSYRFSWAMFWTKRTGSNFGSYGFWGNAFGITEPIFVLGHAYKFDKEVFYNFKLQRLNDAVQATLETMLWYHEVHNS